MAALWTDGTFTTASAIGAPRFSRPIPALATAYILRQDFMVRYDSYSPLALNTAHSEYSDYKLVEESELTDTGIDGICKFTRTYAKPPATWSEPEVTAYNYIGFIGVFGMNTEATTGRDRFTKATTGKIVYTYWIANEVSTSQNGVTVTISDFDDIPFVAATKYYGAGNEVLEVDYLADSPPLVTATTPSRTTYEGWITADQSDDSYSIVAEDCRIERWMGKIFVRAVKYVKAF